MGDITISVSIQSIFKEVARRSSIATETDPFYAQKTTEDKQYSQLHGEGDRVTSDFTREAAKEVLKAYLSRQGDVQGVAFEYGSAATTPTKQKETVTLTGTSGSLNIIHENFYALVTFNTDLATTALDFAAEYAADFLALDIVLTSLDNTLIFESTVAGVPFTAPIVGLQQLTLNGTVEHTTANVTSTSLGNVVYRFSENPTPLSSSQTNAIKERLTSNTKDAIIYYVLVSLYRTDGNQKKEAELLVKALTLIDELSGDLYRLHD